MAALPSGATACFVHPSVAPARPVFDILPGRSGTAAVMDDVTLLTAADAVQLAAAGEPLRTGYGLAGELDRLPGEADDNFLLRTPAGDRYVVKFAHPKTDPEVIDLQARTLKHLETTTNLP